MSRRRRPKSATDLAFQILPPIAGLFALGWIFSPQFRATVLSLVWLALVVGCVVLLVFIARLIARQRRTEAVSYAAPQSYAPSAPPVSIVPAPRPPAPPAPTWSLKLLRSFEWKSFEELVCAYIRELGLQARTTRLGADGGVDIEVLDPGTQRVAMVVQCKAWNAYPVGIKPVRELYGVMASTQVPQCAFFTSGTYTAEALAFGRQHDVDLVDGAEFLSRIQQLTQEQSLRLLAEATRGDYTTPSCPSCGVKMVLRTAGKGRSAGEDFWGCRNYPRCRQTFKLSTD